MIFLNYASSAAALVFYLPFSGRSMKCTQLGKSERPESGIYFKILEKTQYLMNTPNKRAHNTCPISTYIRQVMIVELQNNHRMIVAANHDYYRVICR